LLDAIYPFFYHSRTSFTMNYCKNYYFFSINDINDFIWKFFYKMFSRSFILYRMIFRIMLYESYPKPFLLSSYQANASSKSFSASGLTMTLYFIFYSLFFYKHPPMESLNQDFYDKTPIVHQLPFSRLLLIQ